MCTVKLDEICKKKNRSKHHRKECCDGYSNRGQVINFRFDVRCNVCEFAMREYDFHLSNLYEPLLTSVSAFFRNPHPHPHGIHSFELLLRIWYSWMSIIESLLYVDTPDGGLINMSMREFSVILFRLRWLCTNAKVLVSLGKTISFASTRKVAIASPLHIAGI